jgi:hypothetical protein
MSHLQLKFDIDTATIARNIDVLIRMKCDGKLSESYDVISIDSNIGRRSEPTLYPYEDIYYPNTAKGIRDFLAKAGITSNLIFEHHSVEGVKFGFDHAEVEIFNPTEKEGKE